MASFCKFRLSQSNILLWNHNGTRLRFGAWHGCERTFSSRVISASLCHEHRYRVCDTATGHRLPPVSFATISSLRQSSHLHIQSLPRFSIQSRDFHATLTSCKEESKVEQAVKAIKHEKESEEKDEQTDTMPRDVTPEQAAPTAAAPEPVASVKPEVTSPPPEKPVAKLTLWDKVKHEAKHYYNGFKLLFIDVRICIRLLWQVLKGNDLSRRERRQLVRTTADLFRLVPFSVFIIVPLGELLLPVALRLFPNMLPSTFQTASKEQEKRRKQLKVKLEMAKFLQDTIEETALQKSAKAKKEGKEYKGSKVADFAEFMHRVRSEGGLTTNKEILKYSKLFEDEITLDNLNHAQLVAFCKVLEIKGATIATNNILRFQIELKLRQLEADDKIIRKEGIDALSVSELQEACRNRGMRALGVSADRLRESLRQWIKLHLDERIPPSLLLLSRTLYLPETVATEEVLKATLSQLPDTAASEAKLKISETEGERVDNVSKLEVIKQEQALIEEEAQEKAAEAKKEAEKKEVEAEAVPADVPVAEIIEDKALDLDKLTEPVKVVEEVRVLAPTEVIVDKAAPLDVTEEEKAALAAEEARRKEEEMAMEEVTKDDLEEVEKILETVADEKMTKEHADLEELKEDRAEYDESLEELKSLAEAEGEAELEESKQSKRLKARLNKMVEQIDDVITTLKEEREDIQHSVDDLDKQMKRIQGSKLEDDKVMRDDIKVAATEQRKHMVELTDLIEKMKHLQHVSDAESVDENEAKYTRILENLDSDKDGKVDLDRALKVLEMLTSENVKLSPGEVAEVMKLTQKEQQVEEDEKLERQMEKLERELDSPAQKTPADTTERKP